MIKEYQNIIDAACDRFNNALSQLDIVAWLENFNRSEWKKALVVLNSFEYFSTKDIIKEFDFGLQEVIKGTKSGEKIYLIPIGLIGKSGMAMIYYLKKTPSFNNPMISLLKNDDFSKLKNKCKIIFVDDFSGTGGTILKFYKKIKFSLPKIHTPIALTVAYMVKAKEALEKINIKIIGNERIPAFSQRGSVFGYYPKMKSIRNFCFEYGNKLYHEKDYKNGKTEQHPLGFLNTQALIGFEHSIPNNTLPIIWADVKVNGTDRFWNPLFPRRGKLIVKRAKQIKQTQRYWISIIYKLGLENTLFEPGEKYDSLTIQLLSMIYLKRKQKNPIYICQTLGLNITEYELIIQEAQKRNLLNSEEDITEQAKSVLEQVRKKIKFVKNSNTNSELIIEEDMLYIPKVFRGTS